MKSSLATVATKGLLVETRAHLNKPVEGKVGAVESK
jgi:hypothetical protein